MKRKQRHFFSEQQIVDEIDDRISECAKLLATSVNADAQAKQCLSIIAKLGSMTRKLSDDQEAKLSQARHDLRECRELATKLNKRRHSIEDKALPRLKRTLSAFQTTPMPFSDATVVLQP